MWILLLLFIYSVIATRTVLFSDGNLYHLVDMEVVCGNIIDGKGCGNYFPFAYGYEQPQNKYELIFDSQGNYLAPSLDDVISVGTTTNHSFWYVQSRSCHNWNGNEKCANQINIRYPNGTLEATSCQEKQTIVCACTNLPDPTSVCVDDSSAIVKVVNGIVSGYILRSGFEDIFFIPTPPQYERFVQLPIPHVYSSVHTNGLFCGYGHFAVLISPTTVMFFAYTHNYTIVEFPSTVLNVYFTTKYYVELDLPSILISDTGLNGTFSVYSTSIQQIAITSTIAGEDLSCEIVPDNNYNTTCGPNTEFFPNLGAFPIPTSNEYVFKFTMSNIDACVRYLNYEFDCWGRDDVGQIGNVKQIGLIRDIALSGEINIHGYSSTCVIALNQTVWCIGSGLAANTLSYLYPGFTANHSSTWVNIPRLSNIISMSARGTIFCLVQLDNGISCFGTPEFIPTGTQPVLLL
jgi:hypothetical protein